MAGINAELNALSMQELTERSTELAKKRQDLKLQWFKGGEMNTALFGKTRRELAQVMTVISMKKKNGEAVAPASTKKASKRKSK